MTTLVFGQLLDARYAALAPSLQRLHARAGHWRYRGEVEVVRGRGVLAALCLRATRLPPAGAGPLEVELVAGPHGERWTRHIGGHAMRSRLWSRDGLLCERLGLVTFGFRLSEQHGAIVWRVERVRALGLPLPARWFVRVVAHEFEREGRYRFDVSADLPLVGPLLRYHGWLDVH